MVLCVAHIVLRLGDEHTHVFLSIFLVLLDDSECLGCEIGTRYNSKLASTHQIASMSYFFCKLLDSGFSEFQRQSKWLSRVIPKKHIKALKFPGGFLTWPITIKDSWYKIVLLSQIDEGERVVRHPFHVYLLVPASFRKYDEIPPYRKGNCFPPTTNYDANALMGCSAVPIK